MEFLAKHHFDRPQGTIAYPTTKQDERLSYEDLKNLYFLDHFSTSPQDEQNSIKFLIRTIKRIKDYGQHLDRTGRLKKRSFNSAIANNDFNLLAQRLKRSLNVTTALVIHLCITRLTRVMNLSNFSSVRRRSKSRGRQIHSSSQCHMGKSSSRSKLCLSRVLRLMQVKRRRDPSMTAALRGEELLEIFFAFPPIRMPKTSWHQSWFSCSRWSWRVFELLRILGLKKHPLHTAVGLGKINGVKIIKTAKSRWIRLLRSNSTFICIRFRNEEMVEFLLQRKANQQSKQRVFI